MIPVIFKGNLKNLDNRSESAVEKYSSFQENSIEEDFNVENKKSKSKSLQIMDDVSLFNMNEVDINKKLEFHTPWKVSEIINWKQLLKEKGHTLKKRV